MSHTLMTSPERRAAVSLSLIMALRMLGLFMILPVFSLYAGQLKQATPFLIGLAIGVYGLTQALFQVPFGFLSDRIGRRPVIAFGLLIFIVGSAIAALADTMTIMIIGRALQGAGAVGSAIIAMMADLTRREQRTKAMAIAGMTIGTSFAVAMMTGPLLAQWVNLFWLAAFLGVVAVGVLYSLVPIPKEETWHVESEPEWNQLGRIAMHLELLRLNLGIFTLHAILTASFVVLPISLQNNLGMPGYRQWLIYLPALLFGFLLSVPCIIAAEKYRQLKPYFLGAITLLAIAELLLWIFMDNLLLFGISLLLFFTAFSVLEAFLPSLVSRIAPPQHKGTAIGLYSSSQFLGMFVGGLIGGWIYGAFGLTQVFLVCFLLISAWLAIAFSMKKPQYSSNK